MVPNVTLTYHAQAPVKLGWKTKLVKAVFGRLRKKVTKTVAERDIAAKLEKEEAVRLIKRRIDELDLNKFWLHVRLPLCCRLLYSGCALTCLRPLPGASR